MNLYFTATGTPPSPSSNYDHKHMYTFIFFRLHLLALPFGIAFHHQLVLHSYHQIFLLPSHFLKLVSFLGLIESKALLLAHGCWGALYNTWLKYNTIYGIPPFNRPVSLFCGRDKTEWPLCWLTSLQRQRSSPQITLLCDNAGDRGLVKGVYILRPSRTFMVVKWNNESRAKCSQWARAALATTGETTGDVAGYNGHFESGMPFSIDHVTRTFTQTQRNDRNGNSQNLTCMQPNYRGHPNEWRTPTSLNFQNRSI